MLTRPEIMTMTDCGALWHILMRYICSHRHRHMPVFFCLAFTWSKFL